MSSNTVEKIFHTLQGDPGFAERFKQDAQAAMSGYPLAESERRQILDWDVRALSDAGVNNMLMFLAYTTVFGQQGIPSYLQRLNAPARS